MAILATFKQIRGEGFERATMAALDMADVMEGGLNGALVMIGKALNDPIANLSAMTRAGVQFTQGQKDTIKTLWEAGDTMAAQGIILKELESQFGGAAKAARETFPGALKATENALGDVKEEIGFIIVKNQAFVESLGIVEQWLIDLGEEIRNNKTDLRDMAKNGMLNLVDAMVLGVQAIGGMVSGLKSLSGYVNLIQSIWLKMKEINILIADPFGRDKIWQQMLAEVRQAQVDLAVANVELAVSISGTDEATAAIVARLHELRDKLDAVDASSGDAAATLGTVVVPALEAAGEVASGSKKDLEAFANAMNIINNITINDFFDWEGLTKFKKDMEWINSQQFEAAVTVALGDSDSDIKDLMAKLEKLKDIGSEPLFKSSIFGDSANQDLQNFMSSLEKVFDMYGEIKDREAEIVQLRAEAGAVQDEEKRADALKAIKELEVAYADKAIEGQIAGYRQLFGTSKQMFAENSKAREAMHIAELSMAAIEMGVKLKTALANAIVATTAQGSVPIAGFAMVAAMAAMMGMLLAQIGGSMSGVSGTAVDTGPALPASTVLGGEAGQGSESIANAFDMLEEFHAEEYGELIKIYNELKDLNQNITGLVTAIVRSGIEGFAGGSVTTEATFAKDVAKYTIDPVSKFVTEYVGNLLFGGEVTTTILRAGLDVWGMSMKDALAGFSATVKSFVGVKTEESSGWISGGSYSYGETSGDVDSEITRFFTMIYQNVAESFVSLSEGLFGKEGEQLIGADGLTNLEKVKEYMIGIGRIDLMGLDSDGINKAISEAISNMTDTMAKELFGDFITQYQQIGEGLYETAVRLVMQKEIVLDVLEMTGKAFVAVASDTVSAAEQAVVFSQALIEIAGSLEELTDAASTYFDAFFSDAEKQAVLYGQLTDAFDSLNMTLPDTREGYKALVESLAGATDEASMEAYVALLKLADAADAYYKSLEKATNSILDAQKKLAAGTAYDDIIAKYGLGNLSISQLQAIVDLFANWAI